MPVEDRGGKGNTSLFSARVHGSNGGKVDSTDKDVHTVETSGHEEGGTVGGVSKGEGSLGVLKELVVQEHSTEANGGGESSEDSLGVLGNHGNVSRVVRSGEDSRHHQGTVVPTNGVDTNRGPLHLDVDGRRDTKVHASPEETNEKNSLRDDEDPHTRDHVLTRNIGMHAHLSLNGAVTPPGNSEEGKVGNGSEQQGSGASDTVEVLGEAKEDVASSPGAKKRPRRVGENVEGMAVGSVDEVMLTGGKVVTGIRGHGPAGRKGSKSAVHLRGLNGLNTLLLTLLSKGAEVSGEGKGSLGDSAEALEKGLLLPLEAADRVSAEVAGTRAESIEALLGAEASRGAGKSLKKLRPHFST
mmetsp:Transcript_22673/g.40164  ORF Transcript_22673/g.40164 Transcript_22673/m.40164 type:complete len:356 (-) Transcript_22673:56-1123(-)